MGAFIMSGPIQALAFVVLFALLSMLLPMLGLLSNAAIGLVTLRLGWRRGLLIALAASVITGMASLFLQGNLLAVAGPDLLTWIMVIALSVLLTATASWKYILQAVLGLALTGLLLFHLNVADPGLFWKETLQSVIELKAVQDSLPDVDLQDLADKVASYMTGMFAAVVGLGLILSLMIARHWQAALYNPGGFQQELCELRLDRLTGLIMAALITLALLIGASPMMMDIIMVGLGVFLFQGIALAHGVRAILQIHSGWMLALYLLLVLMPVQMGILLAAFGIIDSMADFRGFLARNRPKT